MSKRSISLELKKGNGDEYSIKGKMEEELDKGEKGLFFQDDKIEEYKKGIGSLLKDNSNIEDVEEDKDYHCKKIIFRRDSFANWQTKNPVLREKEIIVCRFSNGSRCFKIGDGVSKFSELPEIKNISELPNDFYIYYTTHDVPCFKIYLKDGND